MANDLISADILPAHSDQNPKPVTIASAATVAPTTFLSFISGTTAIATVTPPINGAHMLCFIFTTTSPTAFTTTGNIKIVTTPTLNIPHFLVYNPLENKYYTGELTT